ncbi:MAG: UDP-N-acetylmuramoyl-L-alanine--D-glutamate ligase [Desulfovibrio sp.]|jgi:UDP-N-acetylmuramoylalanine--D-glutamate ligase|nr:UDP-N-acetylmuramoyl-L-alanine--D-glutamate ligase [Desulfovibrio sp.]
MDRGHLAVVVGAGRSGLAAARLLADRGARVRLLDRNPAALSDAEVRDLASCGVETILGPHEPGHFRGAVRVVPSPGMPVAQLLPLLSDLGGAGPEVLAEMELAFRCLGNEPLVAVTGTSGKTTTTSLAAAMLESAGMTVFLGGNIGTPLSEHVLSGKRVDALVLEVSSFQLQTCTSFRPQVGVLLNVSPNHQDYHKDMAEYVDAKFRLFLRQMPRDRAVFGPGLETLVAGYPVRARKIFFRDEGRFPESRLLGVHNRLNAEAAWQACRPLGLDLRDAERAVAAFAPLPHRLETVGSLGGVGYVNDSKCTTVSSLEVALRSFDVPVHLLCGGKFKGGDLPGLRDLVRERVRDVALFGDGREHFERAWDGVASMTWHPDMEGAFARAASLARPGDVVLLAPATASFDLYDNYKERGEHFRRLVRERADAAGGSGAAEGKAC